MVNKGLILEKINGNKLCFTKNWYWKQWKQKKMLCFRYCFHYKASKGKGLKVIGNNGNKILYISNIYIIRHIHIYTYTPNIRFRI